MLEFNDNRVLNDHAACRDALTKATRLEILGPVSTDSQELREQRLRVKPTSVFSCGIIFPRGYTGDPPDESEDITDGISDETEEADQERSAYSGGQLVEEDTVLLQDDGVASDDLIVNDERNQSSFGISFRCPPDSNISIEIYFAYYVQLSEKQEDRNISFFERREFRQEIWLDVGNKHEIGKRKLSYDGVNLYFLIRRDIGDTLQVSIGLINDKEVISSFEIYQNSIFQPEIVINCDQGFRPIHVAENIGRDNDTRSNALLYRDKEAFCKGHGCAGEWRVGTENRCSTVRSEFFPHFDIMPILPVEEAARFKNMDFSFYGNSRIDEGFDDEVGASQILSNLQKLVDAYGEWIGEREQELDALGVHQSTGIEHLTLCRLAKERMSSGLELLKGSPLLFKSFRLANYAMYLQQLHGSIKRNTSGELIGDMPDPQSTSSRNERRWRPFQLAFILMNLDGLPLGKFEPDSRDIVDLIWFPTGGGKTEAYLGVAAVAICYSRLLDPNFSATEVIMRYTLRLLTSQQFQRASLLILALEVMRQTGLFYSKDITESSHSFSAGLWVGGDLTPNKNDNARKKLSDLRTGNGKNCFAILTCPWCKKSLEADNYAGYKFSPTKGFEFFCPESKCFYYRKSLPIYVIDEKLYETPPTLLLSTVDKFALLPWYEGPTAFLGRSGKPPSLIIQDELHLISGPLGSVVGHYEDLILDVMSRYGQVPKIVASTATIRRAKEQVDGLYNREVSAFPPQGLSYNDSFFAVEACRVDEDREDVPKAHGRRYVGVFAASQKSHITAQRNLVASVIQFPMAFAKPLIVERTSPEESSGMPQFDFVPEAANKCKALNPYGTLVWYFNSLRELGYADSLLAQDISQHTKNICRRYDIPYILRRRAINSKELTSRTKENEIFKILEDLEIDWYVGENNKAIDALLATSMISVGVDINRLGLMVITGQPKNTSEYIQASSRVGRQKPGLVFTLYNQNRSRDRSHFESFIQYHQAIYRFVEPTSVTPYSYRCRERSLPGLVIGIARHIFDMKTPKLTESLESQIKQKLEAYVHRVVNKNDSDDEQVVWDQIDKIIEVWKEMLSSAERANKNLTWGSIIASGDDERLLGVFGEAHDEEELERINMMTSMRNVDASSTVRII